MVKLQPSYSPHFEDIEDRFVTTEFAFCLHMTSGVFKNDDRLVAAIRAFHASGFLRSDGLSCFYDLDLHLDRKSVV